MKHIGIIIALFSSIAGFGNAAQPGVWSSGGMSNFNLIYPEDSLAFQQIQMIEEDVYIQLYKGFAVTKGVYQLKNTSQDSLFLRTGYPVNGSFQDGGEKYVNTVNYDDLYNLKVSVNDKEPLLTRDTINDDKWFVWPMNFAPNEAKTVTVYFLVNTNVGIQSKGYSKNYQNAYIYLIESGSTWKQPIIKGDFYVDFNEFKSKKIKASLPKSALYSPSLNTIHVKLNDFSPTPDDNLIFTYGKKEVNFDFESITKESEKFYNDIDVFQESVSQKPADVTSIEFQSPYDLKTTGVVAWLFTIFFFIFKFWWLLLILLIGFVLLKRRRITS